MKKLIFLLLILSSLSFAQVTFYKTFTFTSDSISDAVYLEKYGQLAGLFVPHGMADTLFFQVSMDGTSWYTVQAGDSTYAMLVDSVSTNKAIPTKDTPVDGWKWIKILMDKDWADSTWYIYGMVKGEK